MRRWQWEILEHPPYSPDMSPCDLNLFARVKEPLRGTRYSTRDDFIRAIGQSIRNTNKDGHTNVVQRLPKIWQKMIKKGATLLKVLGLCIIRRDFVSRVGIPLAMGLFIDCHF